MDDHDEWLEEGTELQLNFNKHAGLIPVTVQDAESNRVLMLAWTNEEAFHETLKTKKATFWSTSRQELWRKGQTSGNTLSIIEILVDCDQDALVYRVHRDGGGVCHTIDPTTQQHRKTCFYRKLNLKLGQLDFLQS